MCGRYTLSASKIEEIEQFLNVSDTNLRQLDPEEFDDWLNSNPDAPEYLSDFLRPYPDDALD